MNKTKIKKIHGIRYKVVLIGSKQELCAGNIQNYTEEFAVLEEIPDIFAELKGIPFVLGGNEVKWAGISKPTKNVAKKIANGPHQEIQGNVRYTYTPVKGYKKYRSDGRTEDCILVHIKREVAVG